MRPGREADNPIDAAIRALLLNASHRLCPDEIERPPLKLILALEPGLHEHRPRPVDLGRLADNRHVREPEAVFEPCTHYCDRQVSHVDPDPFAVELLRGNEGGPAAAEGIEHDVTRVRGKADHPLQKREGLLRRKPKTLLG